MNRWKSVTWVGVLTLLAAGLSASGAYAIDAAAVPAKPAPSPAPAPAGPGSSPAAEPLGAVIAGLDARLFEAFNAHDLDRLMSWFASDVEFFHDTGGRQNFDQVTAGFKGMFAQDNGMRRDLVPGSLEVYPIKGYGAIEVGQHRFCHAENGREECGTFKFLMIWKETDGAWKLTRVASYGH